ncbi:hypothetical protein [Maribellus mangrovi]|uniref:hypothetical protein n=1 Tax=Maribellus mangrovi TaxID=3133146 RepID=UPI0030EF7C82
MKKAADIYLFNPTCEYAIANGTASWQANRLLQKMESDLATLPMFLADHADHILVEELPSESFLKSLEQLHFIPPKFIKKKEALASKKYIDTAHNRLKPWGWSPAAHKILEPLKKNCSSRFKNSPVYEWKAEHRAFYSKKFGREILGQLLEKYPDNTFINQNHTARICTTKTEIEACLQEWSNLMAKAPWSSSGRGLQRISKTPVHEKVWEKLLGIVNDQGYAIVEPLLNKQLDIAFQFQIVEGKVSFLGISNFSTDSKGQYQGNHLNGLPDSIDAGVREFAQTLPDKIIEPLLYTLENSELPKNYEGNLGVDALVYKNNEGRLLVNPCLEINLRQNMGLLSLHLEHFLVPGKKGIFRTWYGGGKSYLQFKEHMQKKHPLVLQDSRIKSGFLSLTDAQSDTKFGAYLWV